MRKILIKQVMKISMDNGGDLNNLDAREQPGGNIASVTVRTAARDLCFSPHGAAGVVASLVQGQTSQMD